MANLLDLCEYRESRLERRPSPLFTMTETEATDHAVALIVWLAQVNGAPHNDAETQSLLKKRLPRASLTWETHFKTVPGVGDILMTGPRSSELTVSELSRLAGVASAIHAGFYAAAAVGTEFASEVESINHFGGTVQTRYPAASPAFLRFAASYWSFQIAQRAVEHTAPDRICSHLLTWLDGRIAPLFFPIPLPDGTTGIPVRHRERDQRRFLELFAPPEMDIRGFLKGNPILEADRRAQLRGCGASAILIVAAVAVAAAALVLRS